jgi:cyclopropane fatty-acyl-phospholipid synthase-like methyltransferase
MIKQDNFYLTVESDSFFKRNKKLNNQFLDNFKSKKIRTRKEQIYNLIQKKYKIKKKTKVLEVGCYFGDLLSFIKKKHGCTVYGVEPSKKACQIAKKYFSINIENKTFLKSRFFNFSKNSFQKIDIIIFDDILSWIDRDVILPTFGVIDWILKPNGIIFFRDFMPKKNFAHPNHHWKGKEIFNFKYQDGHKSFFLKSGKYKQIYNRIYFSDKMQNIKIKNKDSMLWGDSILKKISKFTHPIITI